MAGKVNGDENGGCKIGWKPARQKQQCLDSAGRGADCQNVSVRHARSPARQPGGGTAGEQTSSEPYCPAPKTALSLFLWITLCPIDRPMHSRAWGLESI